VSFGCGRGIPALSLRIIPGDPDGVTSDTSAVRASEFQGEDKIRRHEIRKLRATLGALLLTLVAGTAVRAQNPGGGSGSDPYTKWDPETNTATLTLIAGPFKFNLASSGAAGFTVPSNAKVVIIFINKDGTPHSAEIISGEGPIPNSATDPAIPRGYTNKVEEGLPQEATDDITFTSPTSGKYRIFCGVPGHGLSGMWIWLTVDPAAKTASFTRTKS
jgi:plastocyanin